MQQTVDPKNIVSSLHFEATGELLRLMDGFYNNIEDGLFEIAYANENDVQQRETVELMRELRFRREHLIKTFGKRLQSCANCWFEEDRSTEYLEEREQADQISARCVNHFGMLLQQIAERTAHAFNVDMDRKSVPLSPEQVSYHFVMSCRSLEFDQRSISLVQDLFHRFVLDRLGGVYGAINQALSEAGFATLNELQQETANSA